jgi:hypothetical protein
VVKAAYDTEMMIKSTLKNLKDMLPKVLGKLEKIEISAFLKYP